jgi:membrane-bound lytic murein transglycosylase A
MRSLALCALLFLSAAPALAKPALEPVSFDVFEKLFPFDQSLFTQKQEVLRGLENSLSFLRTSQAEGAYRKFEGAGINKERVLRSLLRFRTLLLNSHSPTELTKRLRQEFAVVRSKGNDGEGAVRFTGYFQPVYKASLTKTSLYRYPIYQTPVGWNPAVKPHPRRVDLEGFTGAGPVLPALRGRELAYLPSRYEAYMIQVQGSAILELPDGDHISVGFAGATDYPFNGVPKSFLSEKNIRWSQIGEHFKKHPEDLNSILSRNNRFVFFKAQPAKDPVGSLGVPVVAERSIATDKSQMPPGALALVHTLLPVRTKSGSISVTRKPQFVFDLDTGSAIKGPGRVDVFMGTGEEAGQLANAVCSNGNLYYLLLK